MTTKGDTNSSELESPMEDKSPREDSYFQARDQQHKDAKAAVANCIVENYLTEGDSIILDAGTSLYPIAEIIAQRAKSEPGRAHFTIMTHNYRAFEVLVKNVPREANLNIVLAGGRYDQDLNALFGNQTVNAYEDFFPRVVLIGISGMMAEIGLFCHGNTEELAVKKAIFGKRARNRIIVADYTKVGLLDGFRFGEAQGFGANVEKCLLVTNVPPKDDPLKMREGFAKQIQILERQGVEIKQVS
jgi:DeoR/GlpR family transcriptional regulator of sugar metabolism